MPFGAWLSAPSVKYLKWCEVFEPLEGGETRGVVHRRAWNPAEIVRGGSYTPWCLWIHMHPTCGSSSDAARVGNFTGSVDLFL